MIFYKMRIAYDGTAYAGWQVQSHCMSIAQKMQDSFLSVFGKPIKLVGASRTDAGVHALGQIARFSTDFEIDPAQLREAWNNRLPPDIHIRDLMPCTELFHPQRAVLSKTYYYHFFLSRPLPFSARYSYHHHYVLDLEKLRTCLELFKGTHDFRSFCTGYEQPNTTRTIDHIHLSYYQRYNLYRIEVTGHSFLHHMIRRIVGACLYVASRKNDLPESLVQILREKNPHQTLFTAPSCGLMLAKIMYQ